MGDEDKTKPDPGAGEPPEDAPALKLEELLTTLREDKFFAAARDERDVSIVYIDRRSQVFHGAAADGRRFADRGERATRRIGDVVVSALSAAEVAQVQATFTPPAAFDAALRRFLDRGLLILHGPAGSGKRSAAIRLLSALRFDAAAPVIYELNPDMRLVALEPDQLPAGTALLLETPAGGSLAGLSAFQLDHLLRQLSTTARNNGLVIVTEQPPLALAQSRPDLLCPWQAEWPGDRTAVQWNLLERHLLYLSKDDGVAPELLAAQLAAWRGHAGVSALLAQRLMPHQVAELADALLPALTGVYDLDQALARHAAQVTVAVQHWFADAAHPLERKTLLVAAAVFNGALADEVDQAAGELLAEIAPAAKPADAAAPDPFAAGATRSARYAAIGARLVSTPLQGLHYGATTGLALRLDNEAWQKAVLDHLWAEYGGLREPVLAWLERHALYGSQRQRVRAAAALGGLARLNFPLIEARILRQWANSSDPNARRAAGQVLGITMWDEQHTAASTGLLRHWAGLDNWRCRWTAAAACGGLAGLRHPQQALELLAPIADAAVAQPQLLSPLTEAIVKLYIAVRADPPRRSALIHTLRTWSEDRAGEQRTREQAFARRRAAVICFWALLWPATDDPAWRQVVEDMAVRAAPVQVDGVALLRASLNFRQPRDSVRDALHPRRLAADGLRALVGGIAAERDEGFMAAGEGLLQALVRACRAADAAQGADEWAQLRHIAEGWERLSAPEESLQKLLL